MIIYGFRTTESVSAAGEFPCPRCRTGQEYRLLVYKRWFTLYFVPVIPLGRVGEQVECQGCLSRFSPDVLVAGMPDKPLIARLSGDAMPVPPKPAPYVDQPLTSTLSVTSLILGLLSPLLLCLCGISLISSLAAVVTGHLALLQIGRSAGRLSGRGAAVAGLVLGYVLFAASLGLWAVFGPSLYRGWRNAERPTADARTAAAPESAAQRLLAAEMRVLTRGGEENFSGNSPQAKQLAQKYCQSLQAMREAEFSAGRSRVFSLTAGEFIVYCELHPGRCAFIVHVPAYRDFTNEAKAALELRAWQLAQETAADFLNAGDSLAVGLRGSTLYGAILVGRAGDAGAATGSFQRVERESLLAFFPREDRAGLSSVPGAPERAVPPPAPIAARDNASHDLPIDPAFQPWFGPGPPPFPPSPAFRPPGDFSAEPRSALPGNSAMGGPLARPSRPAASGNSDHAAAKLPSVGDVVQTFPDMGWSVESLAFAPQGRYLAAGKLDALLLLLDVETGRRLQSVALREEMGQIPCVAFSSDGGMLFAGGYHGRLQAWNVDEAGGLQAADALQGHTQAVTCLATSPVAPFLLSGSAAGDMVWQSYKQTSAEARRLTAFERSVLAVHLPRSGILAWATDGRRLVQFDLGTAQTVKVSELAGSRAQAAAFSPDGSTLAVSLGSEIRLVDTGSGQITGTLSSGSEMQWSLVFLPDGHRLISGGRGAATLWSLADGRPLGSIDLGGVLYIKSLAAASEGDLLAAIPSAAGQTLSVVRLPKHLPQP